MRYHFYAKRRITKELRKESQLFKETIQKIKKIPYMTEEEIGKISMSEWKNLYGCMFDVNEDIVLFIKMF